MKTAASLLFATAALTLSLWTLTRPGASAPPAPPRPATAPSPCDCADDDLRREVGELRRRLQAAELRLSAVATGRAAGTPTPTPAHPAALRTPAAEADPEKRVYARFFPPTKAVKVHQNENGSIAVANTDPSLTGQTMVLSAETRAGDTVELTITVPPPE